MAHYAKMTELIIWDDCCTLDSPIIPEMLHETKSHIIAIDQQRLLTISKHDKEWNMRALPSILADNKTIKIRSFDSDDIMFVYQGPGQLIGRMHYSVSENVFYSKSMETVFGDKLKFKFANGKLYIGGVRVSNDKYQSFIETSLFTDSHTLLYYNKEENKFQEYDLNNLKTRANNGTKYLRANNVYDIYYHPTDYNFPANSPIKYDVRIIEASCTENITSMPVVLNEDSIFNI